jgi:hypothetical protein
MNGFHRTKRESRVAALIAVVLALFLALSFMLVGLIPFLHTRANEHREWSDFFPVPFGIVGIAAFIAAVRGAWTLASATAVIHVLSVDDEAIEWGVMGKEERSLLCDVARIYFYDSEGLTCVLHFRDGKKARMPYIESLLGSRKSQREFVEYMTTHHPEIPFIPTRAPSSG